MEAQAGGEDERLFKDREGQEMLETRDPEKDEKEKLRKSIKEMMKKHESSARGRGSSKQSIPSIHKIPEKLRKVNVSAYTPRVVSIGPIHKGEKALEEMEPRKQSYMYRLFGRTNRFDHETLEDAKHRKADECVDAMVEMVADAQACYEVKFQERFVKLEFAKMMLVDACFILELLYRYKTDPILSNDLVLYDFANDLILLENQIPFCVLKKLFQLTVEQIPNHFGGKLQLSQLILQFFVAFEIPKLDVRDDDHHHLLHLLLKCYLPPRSQQRDPEAGEGEGARLKVKCSSFGTSCWFSWWCGTTSTPSQESPQKDDHRIFKSTATELDRAGVNFKAGKDGIPLDVEFSTSSWFSWLYRKTTFSITPIGIYDGTESLLRNLIAFEQCYPCVGNHITSYVELMDILIDKEEDVELLENSGVLQNYLGARSYAKDLFNNICKEVVVGDSSFKKQCKDAEDYCQRYWPKTLATLRRKYFSNPWTFISVIAALILFALTVIQTVYTIRSSKL